MQPNDQVLLISDTACWTVLVFYYRGPIMNGRVVYRNSYHVIIIVTESIR